jgi:hypothetical protein
MENLSSANISGNFYLTCLPRQKKREEKHSPPQHSKDDEILQLLTYFS